MLTSLFTAVSGMNANGTALSVIGDNVANMNTTGFKASRAAFGDILSQQLGESQVGRGVLLTSVKPEFTQGTFENTASVLDLALDGDGFFIMKDNSGTYYGRAGQFDVDKEGYVVNPSGNRLQGYTFSATGASTSSLGDINISSINSAPSDTQTVTINANLDSRLTIPAAFDVTDPNNTSSFSTSVTVYDTLGNGHIVNVYFRKDTETATGNGWEWFAVVDGGDSSSGNTEIQAQGTIDFTNNGELDVESAVTYNLASGGFDFNGGAAAGQVIDFDFGTSITTDGGTGLDGTTQFGAPSNTSFQNQDGYSSGSLKSITISTDGIMTGIFTNGQTRGIAQIVLAKFVSPTGLTKMGKGLYAESAESGQPLISTPGNSGTGTVLSNTLELSNVDLAEEFVKMILSQRGFQANSRVISASDELMVELVNLKR
ncbi:MAG: flagellar hook protein FlgE [Nitrospiraceae bacterium]|nr:MAG: flagellar hook protein FlgE [Nitrospiraceae bacterium]